MPDFKQFRLPDLGEGLTEGEILKWLVHPGDQVALNQPIVEVETAKAAVEVPSPFAGLVTELHHAEGETVDVGVPIITIDVAPGAPAAEPPPAADPPAQAGALRDDMVPDIATPRADEAVEPGLIGGPAPGGRTSVLVGYGPKEGAARRRPRRSEPEPAKPAARVSAAEVGRATAARAAAEVSVLAKPPVRKLARDLGVDLRSVTGTGPSGSVTRADVEAAAGGAVPAATGREPAPAAGQRIPIRGVRKVMAEAMVASAFTAPHVTEFITVDVTESMELLDRLRARPEFNGLKVTPLLLVARALIVAVRRNPLINSSWDEAGGEIVVHPQVNLGIAAATPRGLLVPNIKGADGLSLTELAAAIGELTTLAREGKTAPADMQRGTISITNVGVFGVDTGTPIINPGEAAILCLGAVRPMPWVHDGQVAIRQVTQLGLSFDHRIVDGQLGSQFLADIAALLADPGLFAAWG